jgi:hypothetical protein
VVSAAVVLAVVPASGGPGGTSVRTIHVVAHENRNVQIDLGAAGPSVGDEEIFAGTLNDSTDAKRLGTFAGSLISLNPTESVSAATVDLQLGGGQISVHGLLYSNRARNVHPITGGTGAYRGVRGVFAFTEPTSGELHMTLTLVEP